MQSLSNLMKSIQRTDSLRFQDINITDRTKAYRRDILVHVNKSSAVEGVRTIDVIFPCKSRQQLDVSTLHDLHLKIRNHNKTPMSYKLTSTTDVRGKELLRLPIHRSTIYVHKLCNDCND
jgi:hypothetical protein